MVEQSELLLVACLVIQIVALAAMLRESAALKRGITKSLEEYTRTRQSLSHTKEEDTQRGLTNET